MFLGTKAIFFLPSWPSMSMAMLLMVVLGPMFRLRKEQMGVTRETKLKGELKFGGAIFNL